RRHTRSKRDWSSDVCSSDLINLLDSVLFNDPSEYVLHGGDGGPNGVVAIDDHADRFERPNASLCHVGIGGRYDGNGHLAGPGARSEERRVGKGCRWGGAVW